MTKSVASYTRASLDDARGTRTSPLHFIYHVPKCAGRTIDRHLAHTLAPNAYHRLRKRRGLGRFVTGYDPSALPDPDSTLVVSGHYLGISLDPLFRRRLIKRCLLLRDPASHFVSYYNYRMTRYISEGLQPYSVEVAYGAMRRNFLTHYILNNFLELSWLEIAQLSDQDKYDLVNAFLSTFWFVGDYTLCNTFLAGLGDRLGISPHARPCNKLEDLSRGAGWTPLTLDLLPQPVVAKIRAENRIDQRLWETWHDIRHETASVHPLALGTNTSSFISGEAVRLLNQIVRRVQRRWGNFDTPVPAVNEDSAKLA